MAGFILGQKLEQSQIFNENGLRFPVTFIKTSPCYLIDIKTAKKDGYFAVKLGFGNAKNIKKPVREELTKAGINTPLRFLKEIRLENFLKDIQVAEENGKPVLIFKDRKFFIGDNILPKFFFKKGDLVKVTGVSKGKGFQGVVGRYHFSGGPRTHGQSDRERAPGSIGQTTTPGRVYKGKRMAGRTGGRKVTIADLEIIEIKEEGLLVKGLVPGPIKGFLEIKS